MVAPIEWAYAFLSGMADFTIFYSWQMDAPPAINKGFIQEALDAAVKELNNHLELNNHFDIKEADRHKVEQGMKEVPGSPEVATIMFERIGESAIFVADVSLVGIDTRRRGAEASAQSQCQY